MSYGRRAVRLFCLGVVVAFLAVFAACGDSESTGDGSDGRGASNDGGMPSVRVAMNPLAGYSNILVGIDQGIFEEAGVKVEADVTTDNSSALIPLAVRGEYQFVTGLSFNFIQAYAEGLEFQLVSTASPMGDKKVSALLVDGNVIRDAKDLEGKPICTARLGSAQEFLIQAWMRQESADPSKVKPVAVPFPAQVAAVKNGRCAVTATETPFVERGVQDGLTALEMDTIAGGPSALGGQIFAPKDFVEGNEDTVERFVEGLEKASEYANENPDAVRAALVKLAKMDEEQAEQTPIPHYDTTVDVAGGQTNADLMREFGFIEDEVPFDQLVWPGAPGAGGS